MCQEYGYMWRPNHNLGGCPPGSNVEPPLAVVPWFKSTLSGNSLIGKLFTSVVLHQAAKLVAALLRVARVTVGVAESNGSLPPGL